jgi:rod shape-determining protein MreD
MNLARWFGFVLSLAAALILQLLALPPALAPWRPMWPALVVAYWTLTAPRLPNLFGAWLLGLGCDLLFDAMLGEHAITLVVLAYVLGSLRPRLRELPLWRAALTLAPVWGGTAFLLFWIDGLSDHPASPLLRWTPVLATTLAWPVLVMLADAMRPRRRPRPAVI